MVQLNLIELADLVRPDQLVAEIIRQNPNLPIPVPIEEIARLSGINRIEAFSSEGFEGALIANATKSAGAIFFSALSPRPRQRFTIGHELGHFLLPWHRQTSFSCTAEDIGGRANKEWEIQANQFAAELLMPAQLVKNKLHSLKDPELAHIVQLRDQFGTSMEMTARRLVELSEYACAVVFSKDNTIRYAVKSEYFVERLAVRKGDRLPTKSPSRQSATDPDEWFEIDSHWWLTESSSSNQPESVYEQTLVQENGHKLTLVTYDPE
ncbi:ImmA/IrrE family metallo-endopeptidase [Aquabacterium sp.]|uniref:ImmA/IrrE family metallo-endopeptidase n=1 Tax=Aquabacterium sp. TaxID=1872578 RepID=UPI00248A211C|nr:ImmA/IrrE family metallo-endopeptidase [Aquabacterium sp.]MDI1258264.1 ImmA/IrrE family metallo-endopeptidase [Aquabacterium sp.]